MLRHLLVALLILPLAAGGCGTPRPAADPAAARDTVASAPPTLDAPFTLARGSTATVDGLDVTFATVLEDSRCPLNVTCVWEGRATINLELAEGGRTGGINLTLPGNTGAEDSGRHPTVMALGHHVTLMALDPYPGSDEAEAGGTPTATLVVARSRN